MERLEARLCVDSTGARVSGGGAVLPSMGASTATDSSGGAPSAGAGGGDAAAAGEGFGGSPNKDSNVTVGGEAGGGVAGMVAVLPWVLARPGMAWN